MKTSPFIGVLWILLSCGGPYVREEGSDWKSIESDLQTQFITAKDSSTITLPEGSFLFTRSLLVDDKHHLTIRGAGVDQTILSFSDQEEGAEGLKISNCTHITLEDFTIEDAAGDNLKVTDTRGITFRRVKSQWTGSPNEVNGAYAFYPVLCKQVVVENCIAIGSSDAGIYVGQSDSVIIRNNEVYFNVAGIESENSKWVEIYGNVVHENTGGILVFDLPGLTQNGHTIRVYENRVFENNFTNFAPAGNIVATVPPGTGVMLLATRNVEIFKNEIIDNRTAGTAIASYDLVAALGAGEETQLSDNIETAQADDQYDPYPNQIYIHDNIYRNRYFFPTMENDFGLLFATKFPLKTPDIVWDGITPDRSNFSLCIQQDEHFRFGDLDAANDFENLSTDWSIFNCSADPISPIF